MLRLVQDCPQCADALVEAWSGVYHTARLSRVEDARTLETCKAVRLTGIVQYRKEFCLDM